MSRKPLPVQAVLPIAEGGRRRLQLISSFMSTAGDSVRITIDKKAIAYKLGVEHNTAKKWFLFDDVFVSHIFGIADAFGLKVRGVSIKPKD